MGEEDEVSIKDVADGIVKAMNFQGEYAVSYFNKRFNIKTNPLSTQLV